MKIKGKLSLTIVAIGIMTSSVGCSLSESNPDTAPTETDQITPITVPADVKIDFTKPKVETSTVSEKSLTVPDPEVPAEPIRATKMPQTVEEVATPVNAISVIPPSAKIKATIPAAPVEVAPIPVKLPVITAPSGVREIHVALTGGATVLDSYAGPVLYQFPTDTDLPPYVAEHDLTGGWERFGSLTEGMSVKMTGHVTGTYTVGQILNVSRGADIAELKTFDVTPKVMLQTCIPWTNRMIVVGLY